MKDPKVLILLSSYNGEKYIKEQLDSLLAQTYKNTEIFIRDDGSTDRTLNIIKEYIAMPVTKPIHLINNSCGLNLGYMESFQLLLSSCPNADYYAFCDQDDVWLPSKIELAVNSLEVYEPEIPLLYSSSFDYYSSDLVYLGHAPTPNLPIKLKDVLFYTPAFGFTIVLNHSLREMAIKTLTKHTVPHDDWLLKIAAAFGKIIYNPTSGAKYRRHAETVTFSGTSCIHMIIDWLQKEILGTRFQNSYKHISCFLEDYHHLLSSEDKKLLTLFSLQPVTIHLWLKRLFYPHRLRPTIAGEIAVRICFFLNR